MKHSTAPPSPTPHPEPPELWYSFSEGARALMEVQQLLFASPRLRRVPRGDGHPVMTLPGFGGADGCMSTLRRWLKRWGYDARPWELGRNLPKTRIASLDDAMTFRKKMVQRAARKLQDIHKESGRGVSLIGWSMGGLYAHELSQLHPELVRSVITLGTPHGDPRGTAAWNIMRRIYRSEVPEEAQDVSEWVAATVADVSVPMTIIFSPIDGVVSQEVARMDHHPNVTHLAVNSSHLGFALNPRVYRLIARQLARPVSPHPSHFPKREGER